MSNLGNAKILGGIGALLMLIGFFVSSFGALLIIGLILLFIGIKFIADETKDKKIFDNFLYYFICHLIAIVAVLGILTYTFVNSNIDFTNIQQIAQQITDFNSFMDVFGGLIVGCLAAFIIGWILFIIGSLFLRKSFNSIAQHTNVGLFKTAGLVYLIGALTMIIFIGIIIIWVALIIEVIAFFSLPEKLPSSTAAKASKRRCPNCGRTIPEDARACPYCAKKFDE